MARPAHMEKPVKTNDYRGLRIAGIVCGCILALIVLCYAVGIFIFSNRLWPGTTVKGVDVSLQAEDELVSTLSSMSSGLSVRVSGQGVDFSLDSADAGLSLNVQEAAESILSDVSAWQWPVQVLQSHDESEALATSYNREAILSAVEAAVSVYNSVATDPQDAYIVYDSASQQFVINPGSVGTKLDASAVTDAIIEALENDRSQVSLTSDELVKQTRTSSDSSLLAALSTANSYLTCNLNLTLNGTVITTLNADVVGGWVTIGDDLSVSLDDEQLVAWVDTLEAQIDNVGETRTYTRPDGKVVTVTGGSYGWITNGASIEEMVRYAIENGSVGDEEIPLKQSAAVYNPGGQDWGARYVDVDITEQHARFYDSTGSLIWETDIISGATFDNRETPTGVYYITNKAMNQTLIGKTDPSTGKPIYETPVTYWMPFVGNSVGLHDATWQSAFGGTLYQTSAGSHGCINLPYSAAETLYSLIQVGDVVITHY